MAATNLVILMFRQAQHEDIIPALTLSPSKGEGGVIEP